jgi:hypothetical protein
MDLELGGSAVEVPPAYFGRVTVACSEAILGP